MRQFIDIREELNLFLKKIANLQLHAMTTLKLAGSMLLMTTILATTNSFGQVTTPRTPSPAATVSQTIGISTVSVSYSRPSVKGRKVWGGLVPYGWNVQGFGAHNPAPWRAGANENTVITFSHPASVEGHLVPAGQYGLSLVVNPDNTAIVMLSKDSRSWGSFWYDSTADLLRATIHYRDNEPVELLTYSFENLTKNSADAVLTWEKKAFPVKIEFAVDDIVLANAEQELKGTIGFGDKGYASAATYALNNNTHLDKALEWADIAVNRSPDFPNLATKSRILDKMGKTAEADKIMSDALVSANETQINNYGYSLLQANKTEKAIQVFQLNTQRFPKSANTWDSLGEAYVTAGDKKNAIASFKKSLSLNPPEATKANSEKFLAQLGGK